MPVVLVELLRLGTLPAADALECALIVGRPGKARLEQDLARLATDLVAAGAVGIDHPGGVLGVGQRPEAIALARRDPRGLRPERRYIERRAPVGVRVEERLIRLEMAPIVGDPLAVEEAAHQLQRLLHTLDLSPDLGPRCAK